MAAKVSQSGGRVGGVYTECPPSDTLVALNFLKESFYESRRIKSVLAGPPEGGSGLGAPAVMRAWVLGAMDDWNVSQAAWWVGR